LGGRNARGTIRRKGQITRDKTVDTRSNAVRFGSFELDLRTGELRKESGARIRLEGQPIQILLLLLDRPGELVTQEEVRKKLWPDGTVVEYEHSIKTALRKLRQALGDSAEASQYIETLPRRGYRFIAVRLILGVDAEERVKQAEAARASEAEKWRYLTVSTVFEDGLFDSRLNMTKGSSGSGSHP
jgi:DNA-binding winged helix-turn-helix (wHTH) protein